MMWKDVYETYFSLPEEEKRKFRRTVEKDNVANKSDIAKLINDIRETKSDIKKQLRKMPLRELFFELGLLSCATIANR